MYYRLIEVNNTSEGETWNAFIKIPQTEEEKKAFEALKRLVKLSDNDDEEDSYYFEGFDTGEKKSYSEAEVNLLLIENNFSMNGYMDAYMIGEVSPNVFEAAEKVTDATPWYEVQNELYKMKLIINLNPE